MSRTTLTLATQRRFAAGVIESLPDGMSEERALWWLNNKAKLKKALGGALIRSDIGWLDQLIQAENDAHRAFFGQTFDLSQFAETLERYGEERVDRWAKLLFEPHFLPKWQFSADAKIRGWKVKPEAWFWEKVAAGNIKRRNAAGELETVEEVGFDGVTLLIDTRCKPHYSDGRQMFENDGLMGGVIEALREQGKIARYDPQSSRFGISSCEWDEQIRPALEALPEFEGASFRLELASEAIAIPQIFKRMPRRKDGQTSTLVWYEEFFEGASHRLCGGNSDRGGLAYVYCSDIGGHWYGRAVRPVGVLDAWSV